MNSKTALPLVLVLVSLFWAGSFIVVRLSVSNISPINLGFLRFCVATPIMIFILLIKGGEKPSLKKEWKSLCILGLTGVTLLYIFQFLGITLSNASTSAVLINTNVVFIVVLSIPFLKEQMTSKKIAGIGLSFSGVLVILVSKLVLSEEQILFNNEFFLGCLLILLSALCWAVYSIVGKKLLKQYDNLAVTTYAFTLGTLFYLPVVLPGILETIPTYSLSTWGAILYLALTCSVFGYLGWYYVLQKTEASNAAVFLNFIPLFTIVMSLFIGEPITLFFLIGAILIIYGVYVTQRSKRKSEY